MGNIKNRPELRFGGFLGEWLLKDLGSLSTLVTSGSRDWAQYYSISGDKFIRMTNLPKKGIQLLLHDLKFVELPASGSEGARTSLSPKDILISITAELGKVGLVPDGFGTAYINQHTALVRLNSGTSPEFIAHYLAGEKSNKKINRLNDSGAKSGLNLSTVRDFKIDLPSLPEQQKIAAFLGAVDDKLTALRRKRELLQEYKRGMMQKIFSRELRFKGDAGVGFPDWEEKRLGEAASICKGKGISKNDIVEGGLTPCIRYGELYTRYDEVIDNIVSFTNEEGGSLLFSQADDVIIPASGEAAIDIATASCVTKAGVALGGDLNVIRGDFNGVFLAYYLNNGKRKDVARLAQGVSVVHLYGSHLVQLQLRLPCLEEQQKIADFLAAIDIKIESVAKQIEQVETFKKGLLQKMFV